MYNLAIFDSYCIAMLVEAIPPIYPPTPAFMIPKQKPTAAPITALETVFQSRYLLAATSVDQQRLIEQTRIPKYPLKS